MVLVPRDIDRDGRVNEAESVKSYKDKGMIDLKDSTELGETLGHLNKDIENNRRLSSVDFISRLNGLQIPAISCVEFITAHGVISRDAKEITRIIKRNVISLEGKGRDDIVNIAVGKTERDIRKAGIHNLSPVAKEKVA
jgi:hypothetical protein